MVVLNLLALLLLQTTPKPIVIVGLFDGQQLAIETPQYSGFIENRDSDAVLLYRQKHFRGEMKLSTIRRIDLTYQKGKPFLLGVTLKNGQKIDVESDRRSFVAVQGATDTGTVIIKNPDPISPKVRLTTKAANREHDLTIKYFEFPGVQ